MLQNIMYPGEQALLLKHVMVELTDFQRRSQQHHERVCKVGGISQALDPIRAYNSIDSIDCDHHSIWQTFIPFESYQVFQRGGYYSVEVVPKQLAVISLNTMYFYDSNKGRSAILTLFVSFCKLRGWKKLSFVQSGPFVFPEC